MTETDTETDFSTLCLNDDWQAALSSRSVPSTLVLHERFEQYLQKKQELVHAALDSILVRDLLPVIMQYSIRDSVQYQSGKSLETGDLVLVHHFFLTDCYMPAIVVHAQDTQLFVHYLDTPREGDEWVDLPYPIPHGLTPIVKLNPGATNTKNRDEEERHWYRTKLDPFLL